MKIKLHLICVPTELLNNQPSQKSSFFDAYTIFHVLMIYGKALLL